MTTTYLSNSHYTFTELSSVPPDSITFAQIENNWFYEKNSAWAGICIGYEITKIIAFKKSEFQEILIFDSLNHGRVLVHDGVVQFNTVDEYIYHEMMSHTPLFSHPNPRSVLVIGGGDGGCIREIIKHDCIENIVWIEIDEDVIHLCNKYFNDLCPKIVRNDSRVSFIIGDGIEYVRKCKSHSFDIIIVDGSDPLETSPSQVLFSAEFYSNCYRVLCDYGVICSQNECLFSGNESLDWGIISESMRNSLEIHGNNDVRYFSFYAPMYTCGQLGGLIARKSPEFMSVDKCHRSISNKIQNTLKYYSKNVHSASFVLPYFAQIKILKIWNRIKSKL